jgi:hypothetical protein
VTFVNIDSLTLSVISSKRIFLTNERVEINLSVGIGLTEDIYFLISRTGMVFYSYTFTSGDGTSFIIDFGEYMLPGEYCIGLGINKHEIIENCSEVITIINAPQVKDIIFTDNSNSRVIKIVFDEVRSTIMNKCLIEEITGDISRLREEDIVLIHVLIF